MVKNVLIIAGCVILAGAAGYGVYEYLNLKEENEKLKTEGDHLRTQIALNDESLKSADILATAVLSRYDIDAAAEEAAERIAAAFLEKRHPAEPSKPVLATLDGVSVMPGLTHAEMQEAQLRATIKTSYIEAIAVASGCVLADVAGVFEKYHDAAEKLFDQVYQQTVAALSGGSEPSTSLIGGDIQSMIEGDPELEELSNALGELAVQTKLHQAG